MSKLAFRNARYRWLFFIAALIYLPASAQDCEAVKKQIESLHPSFKHHADNDLDSALMLSRQILKLALRCPDSNAFYLLDAIRFPVEHHPSLDSSAIFLAQAEGYVEKYSHLLKGEQYHEAVIPIRYNRCRNMTLTGLYDKATECFENLEKLMPDSVSAPVLISMRYLIPSQLGAQQYAKGNFPEALRWNHEALNKLDEKHEWFLWYKGVAHYYVGQCYFQLGDRKNARQQFFHSVNTFLQVDSAKRESTDDYLLDTYLELCDFYLEENQPDSALAIVESAFSLQLKEDWNPANAYRKKGEILLQMGKTEASLSCLREALEKSFGTGQGKHVLRGLIFKALGEWYLSEKQPLKALGYIQQGLAQLNEEFPVESTFDKNPDLQTSPSPKELLSILHLKGRALAVQTDVEPEQQNWLLWSAETYSTAVQLLQILRTDYDQDESKELLSQHSFALFEEGIEVCQRLFSQTRKAEWREAAFLFSEKSKALSLLESLAGISARRFAGIPDSLLSLETELQLHLATLDREVQSADTPESLKAARSLAFEQRRKLGAFRQFLKDSFPDYFKLKYSFPTLTMAELQAKLSTDETFVEYFWGDRKLYFFTATRDSAGFGSFDLPDSLQLYIEGFKNLTASRKDLNRAENLEKHLRMGHSLYRQLVEPLRIKTPKVLLAADAWLNLLPFDALATDSLPRKDYSEFPFLIHRLQITKVFSASVLEQQWKENESPPVISKPVATKKTGHPSQKKLLVIAPQTFGGKTLPGRPDSLAMKFGGDSFLGAKASKAAVFDQAPDYRRLVFYSHAKADTVEPFIQLFGEDQLFLGDLYAHRLPVKLVVLAACEAGTGKIKRGEGIMSLARGFAYSGVPAVSLTLWEVRSGTTLLITEYFLENHLRRGMSPGDAMHQAKLRFLKNPPLGDANPNLWAGFVMVGR